MAARTATCDQPRRSGRRNKSPIDRYGSSSAQTFTRPGGFDYQEIEARDAHYKQNFQLAQPQYRLPRRRSTDEVDLRSPRRSSQQGTSRLADRPEDRSATISRPGLSTTRGREELPKFTEWPVERSPEPIPGSRAPPAPQVRFDVPFRRPSPQSPPHGEAWTIASDQSDRTPGEASGKAKEAGYFPPPPEYTPRAPSPVYSEDAKFYERPRSPRTPPSPSLEDLKVSPTSALIEYSTRYAAHSVHYLRFAAGHMQRNPGRYATAHKVVELSERLLDQAFRLELWVGEVQLDNLTPFSESGRPALEVMIRTLYRLKDVTKTLVLQCERYDATVPPPSAVYRDVDGYDSGTGESDDELGPTTSLRDPEDRSQGHALEQAMMSVDAKLSTLRRLTRTVRGAGPDPGAKALDMHALEMFQYFGTASAVAESGVDSGTPGDAALKTARLKHGVRERIKY